MARDGLLPYTTILWCCLTAAAWGHTPGNRSAHYDLVFMCSRCNGTGQGCFSQDCVDSCPAPNVCYNGPDTTGPQCCCAGGSGLEGIDIRRQCQPRLLGGRCILGCCLNSSVMCGNTCCGGQHTVCGRKPRRKPDEQSQCCANPLVPMEKQLPGNCCLHGVGKKCDSKWQNETCCLTSSNSYPEDPDLYAVCRVDCTGYVEHRCHSTVGVNCTVPHNNPLARGLKSCCLSQGSPSKHDPCQPSRDRCWSFYQECPDPSQMGFDCSTGGTDSCCLPDPSGVCRRHCFWYNVWQWLLDFLRGNWGLILLIIIVLGGFKWLCRARILSPAHCVYISCVISCSEYPEESGLGRLNVHAGAKRLASALQRAGHQVIVRMDATLEGMRDARDSMFRAAEQQQVLLGEGAATPDFVFQFFFIGHGYADANGNIWLGTDSKILAENGTEEGVQITGGFHLWEDLQMLVEESTIYTTTGAGALGLSRPIDRAQFICWSDCCRTLYDDIERMRRGPSAAGDRAAGAPRAVEHPDEGRAERASAPNKPQFHNVHSTLLREVAVTDGDGSSDFTSALTSLLPGEDGNPVSIPQLAIRVQQRTQEASGYTQRVTRDFTSSDIENVYMTRLTPHWRAWLSFWYGRTLLCTHLDLAFERLRRCLRRPLEEGDLTEALREQNLLAVQGSAP